MMYEGRNIIFIICGDINLYIHNILPLIIYTYYLSKSSFKNNFNSDITIL